jgi:adenylate cyclase
LAACAATHKVAPVNLLARHRIATIAAICAFCTGVILFSAPMFPHLPFASGVWTAQRSFEDFVQREGRKTATRTDFVFLGIDQSTLQLPPFLPEEIAGNRALQLMTERPFPWSREVWAILLDKLFASGAQLVLFDIVFNQPNDGDAAFRDALERHRERVVLGANFDVANAMQLIVPNESLVPPPQMRDDRVGYVVFFPDSVDGKLRSALYTTSDRQLAGLPQHASEEVFESLSARAIEKLGHGRDVPRDQRPHVIRFSDADAYQPRPLWEVFDPKLWQANYGGGAFFKDKVVVVGAASQIAHDVVATPISSETRGPTVHLQAIAAAMSHEFLSNTSDRSDIVTLCAAGVLAWALIAFIRRPLTCIALLFAISVAYLAAARVVYDRAGLLMFVVPAMTAFLTGGSFSLGFDYGLERIEKLRTRRTLERYVSKNLVKEILDNPHGYYSSLKGARVPATMLFSDLIGFTTLSERADPEALVAQLNEYLSAMTAVVFEHGGTLDKFIGDAIMAVWGNVRSLGVAEDAKACARAALDMRRALRRLNDGWRAQSRLTLGMGVGINQGDVLVGNIGSSERADPTVIGDAVNLASRLEGLTRIYGVDILVGETAAALIRDTFHLRSVARAQVKGKTRPVEVFTLIAERGKSEEPELLKWLATYEEALQRFRERHFSEAKLLFSRFLEFYPGDSLAKMYLDRALEYEQAPPEEAWNAVEVFKKK